MAPHAARIVRLASAIVTCAMLAAPAAAQTLPRAANIAALAAHPAFYVDRTVVVRGRLHDLSGRLSLEDGQGHRVLMVARSRSHADGDAEVTGVLWDVGRMKQDDPRLSGYDLAGIVGAPGQEWPRPGDVFVFAATAFASADRREVKSAAYVPDTIRSLILDGPAAGGRQVTVVGQFSGRNLFGDQPRSPGVSRWDFVLRSAEASIWVTGMQPHGRDFDFDPDRRVDSNRWLQVTGTIHEDGGLMWIAATKLGLAQPDKIEPADSTTQPKVTAPAALPEVVFSVPAQGETDVDPGATVRIQLSRTIDPGSLVDHMRASYVPAPGGQATSIAAGAELQEQGGAPSGAIAVLVIRFKQPLERFRTVRVELLEGIKASDGQALKPWTLTFTVGGH